MKLVLIMVLIILALLTLCASTVDAQDQNAPPILYVRERNWRISEAEEIGQIIDRVRAEDPDGDELIFGMEPRIFTSLDANNKQDKLPFRIDPDTGVVYLNESLVGRAGENFLIYITVSDGRYTAKNEVFINILGRHDNANNGFGSRSPPSISNVVHNISQFLPAFDQLPGVQSIRNSLPNRRPSNFPLPFPGNRLGPTSGAYPPFTNFYQPPRPTANGLTDGEEQVISTTVATTSSTTPRNRIKLTPVSGSSNFTGTSIEKDLTHSETEPITLFGIKPTSVLILIAICSICAAGAVVLGYLCRRRLCAISKTLKKKSKEELAKKANQSNLSSTLTDDSHNSMVMQQWSGPLAYSNRYVPWERDQALPTTATSQLSSNINIASASMNVNNNSAGVVPLAGCAVPGASSAMMGTANDVSSSSGRYEFARHRLKFFNILGEGAFGQVWRCEATDIDGCEGVTTVAVKTLKESATEVEKKDLLSELEVMKTLDPHINIVRLLGCCTDKDPTFVIIEYMNRGKLQTYLRNSRAERHYGNTHGKSNVLTSGDLTSFMYQVAKGMDYLTSRGIIHRDLAARNILVTDDHICKVADFGFARDIVTSKIYERKSEGKLPIRWMATESLYDNIFTVKSDIWSFGILMWEIVTLGSTPYPGISAADVMRKVRDGYRLEKPEHCRRELYNIMYYCWSQDPNERPTFSEIIQMLDKLLHTEMDYIELDHFPDHNYYNIVNISGEKL